jgi:hypothetical protein
MPTSNTALRVTELDFGTIKENLKNYLRNQSEFQDFDFTGSGMSVLLDVLAYNTHYMGYYLNMVGNEMFLDTAQLRSSVLSHAKALNYIPTSKIAAKVDADIVVTPSEDEDTSATTLTLDKYTKFLARDKDGVNYQFVTENSNTVTKSGSSFTFNNIRLVQGEINTLQFLMDDIANPSRRFHITSQNVDTSTITVLVQASATNTDVTQYLVYNDITEVSSNTPAFFVEEREDSSYTLYFGDGVIGKKPQNDSIIVCTYLDTSGSVANNISVFALNDDINGFSDNVEITAANSSFGGIEKESIEQVRFRAPYYYTTQNRAVTTTDYQTLITKDYPNIESVSAWGGEDNDPVVYGKIFLSLKTRQNIQLTNADKENIKNTLIRNRNVVTVTPEIVDPDLAYLRIFAKVNYNPSLTAYDSGQLSSLVRAAIFDYNDEELNTFDATFRKSKLSRYIEGADKSIVGTDITVFVQKKVTVDPLNSRKYEVNFNMPLRKGNYSQKFFSFPEILIDDTNGIERETLFEEVLDAPSGINSIAITNGGSSYQSAPEVIISGDGTGAKARAYVSGGKVYKIDITNPGVDYTRASVTFSGGEGRNAAGTPQLENNFGTIRSFYYDTTGKKVIMNSTIGSINYQTGFVTVGPFRTAGTIDNAFYGTNIVTFYTPAANEILLPLRNRILTIDENDTRSVIIEMIAEE